VETCFWIFLPKGKYAFLPDTVDMQNLTTRKESLEKLSSEELKNIEGRFMMVCKILCVEDRLEYFEPNGKYASPDRDGMQNLTTRKESLAKLSIEELKEICLDKGYEMLR
jgi:hypothetical protein